MGLTTTILTRLTTERSVTMTSGVDITSQVTEVETKLSDGDGTGENDEKYCVDTDIATGGFFNMDLFALVDADALGTNTRAVSLAKLKTITVKNLGTTGYVEIGGGTDGAAAADAWLGILKADAGVITLAAGHSVTFDVNAGLTVTNATSHILCFAALVADTTVRVHLTGVAV